MRSAFKFSFMQIKLVFILRVLHVTWPLFETERQEVASFSTALLSTLETRFWHYLPVAISLSTMWYIKENRGWKTLWALNYTLWFFYTFGFSSSDTQIIALTLMDDFKETLCHWEPSIEWDLLGNHCIARLTDGCHNNFALRCFCFCCQMPRGNLETIHPRSLVLSHLQKCLDRWVSLVKNWFLLQRKPQQMSQTATLWLVLISLRLA